MSTGMSTAVRIYRGLARRERAGWIAGLSPMQALTCLALGSPVPVTASAGRWAAAGVLVVVCGTGIGLVVVPVRGRPAARWVTHLLLYQVGVATGWSRWRSKAATGRPTPPDELDLPGMLQRISLPDGPVFTDAGRVCLIHDTVEARWGATARLTHPGVGMASDDDRDRLAARLGNLLIGLGDQRVADRVSLLVRTVPDDGSEYRVWRADHRAADAPRLAERIDTELDQSLGRAVRTEVFVTVSAPEHRLRKPAAAAGGGIPGRARVLYRALDGLDAPLRALGAQAVRWLDAEELAEAIRTGFNPAARAVLAEQRARGGPGLERAAAGPVAAPPPHPRSYTHDAFTTVTYAVLMPEAGTVFGSLHPLLAAHTAGERRTVAIHYEVLDPRHADRAVRAHRFRATVLRDWRRSKGFTVPAGEQRDTAGAHTDEHAVAAGHAMVRYAAVTAVTVPRHWPIEDHAARLEHDAAGRFRLLRLDLAQDTGFVTACLPLGLGLPRTSGGLA